MVFMTYYLSMPSNPNQLLELKIAGRCRMIPVWASKLPFEVRPGLKFDPRAGDYFLYRG